MERFTRREILRILDLSDRQLSYWQRLHLVQPRRRWGQEFYTFNDLIGLRTVKQLTGQRVPARKLRRAIEALQRQLGEVEAPLSELRILSDGRQVVVEHRGTRLEPLSGQLRFNFETRELAEKVRVMPERTVEEWFALGLEWQENPATHGNAIDAYQRVVAKRPRWFEALINLGTLLCEKGDTQEAATCFRRALAVDPESPLVHYNIGSVLDELGQPRLARVHLRQALRLRPDYADACYNLALVCEKIGAYTEARIHWRRYLQLDPQSRWAELARQHLQALSPEASA